MTLPSVLAVDDDRKVLRSIVRSLKSNFEVVCAQSAAAALECVAEREFAVIVTDHSMPGMSGFDMLQEVAERYPSVPTVRVVLSGQADLEVLERFVNRCQISHFLQKPFDPIELRRIVDASARSYAEAIHRDRISVELTATNEQLADENRRLRERLGQIPAFDRIVGRSAELRAALQRVDQVRRSQVTAHIRGETGTGKELVARAIHESGARADRSFVAQNCAGLDTALLQSTLFGHRKGAFTGADRDRPGVFQEADGGTLFLDEVAELSPPVQAALLRALQEGEIVPVGSTQPIKVDIRLISATHVDLREKVAQGLFREDLYYRLVVVSLDLPPLRERTGDVAVLCNHFLQLYARKYKKSVAPLSTSALLALERYPWPGNVRELSNEMERLVVLVEQGRDITPEMLSPHVVSHSSGEMDSTSGDGIFIPYGLPYDEAREKLSRWLIERALRDANGVVRGAADALGMERSRLAKLRRRLGLVA